MTACIPLKANRGVQIPHDRTVYRQRHGVENVFGQLENWSRPLRSLRPYLLSVIFIAATVNVARSMSPEPN